MIIVSGTMSVEPDDSEAVLALTHPCVAATLEEDGCSAYGFFADPNQAGSFRVYEEWADDDALNAHMGSAHMAEFLGQIGSVRITGVNLNKHEVSAISKLM